MYNLRIDEAKAFVDSIKHMKFFHPESELQGGDIKLFETINIAASAALAARSEWNGLDTRANHADWNVKTALANLASRFVSRSNWDATINIVGDIADSVSRDAINVTHTASSRDAELMALCILVQDFINPDHLAYARRRWSIWQAGYGVSGEVNGVFYCYRRIE